jgi:hypothetical protein
MTLLTNPSVNQPRDAATVATVLVVWPAAVLFLGGWALIHPTRADLSGQVSGPIADPALGYTRSLP